MKKYLEKFKVDNQQKPTADAGLIEELRAWMSL